MVVFLGLAGEREEVAPSGYRELVMECLLRPSWKRRKTKTKKIGGYAEEGPVWLWEMGSVGLLFLIFFFTCHREVAKIASFYYMRLEVAIRLSAGPHRIRVLSGRIKKALIENVFKFVSESYIFWAFFEPDSDFIGPGQKSPD